MGWNILYQLLLLSSYIGAGLHRSNYAFLSLNLVDSSNRPPLLILTCYLVIWCSVCLCQNDFNYIKSLWPIILFGAVDSSLAFHLATLIIGCCIFSHSFLLKRTKFALYSSLRSKTLLFRYLICPTEIFLSWIIRMKAHFIF